MNNGRANITNTTPYAVPNNYMQNGSLTIGDISLNYGNGTYSLHGGVQGRDRVVAFEPVA